MPATTTRTPDPEKGGAMPSTTTHRTTVTPAEPETPYGDGAYTLACTCGEHVTYRGRSFTQGGGPASRGVARQERTVTATFTPDRWPAYCLICADLVPAGDGEMAAHCEARHPMDRLRPLLKRTALALDDRRALARAHWEGLREDGGKPFSTAAAFTTLWRWTGRIDRCHKAATCTPMAVSPAYLRGEAPA